MSHRYFAPDLTHEGPYNLAGREAHHLLHVMRAQPDDELTLFDGQGREARAIVRDIQRHQIELDVGKIQDISRELSFELTLAVALPKGERQRWLVEKCVELGVKKLVPLQAQRSVAKLSPKAEKRLVKYVVEACKQGGRNQLMELSPPAVASEFFIQQQGDVRWCADPTSVFHPLLPTEVPAHVTLAIGPEGGFSDEEIHAARSNDWRIVQLGSRILRTETAAVALAAWWGLRFG